jgi:hypothetical protein
VLGIFDRLAKAEAGYGGRQRASWPLFAMAFSSCRTTGGSRGAGADPFGLQRSGVAQVPGAPRDEIRP